MHVTHVATDLRTSKGRRPGVVALWVVAVSAVCLASAQAAPPPDHYLIDTGATGAIGVAPGAGDDPNSGGAECTLRDALDIVSAGTTAGPVTGCDITAIGAPDPTAPVYVVPLPTGGYTYTLIAGFGNDDLDINDHTVFILGDTADNTIIQAAATAGTATNRVITTFRATVELANLTVRHGFHAAAFLFDGGGILNRQGPLVLDGARVEDNGNRGRGGGIHNDSGTVTLRGGALVRRNAPTFGGAGSDGGGIFTRGTEFLPGSVVIEDGAVSDNVLTDGGEGGGIANQGVSSVHVLAGGRVENNVITGVSGVNEGGGISSSGASALVVIDGGVVAGNRVTGGFDFGRGGGIHNDFFGTLRVENGASIEGNVAGSGSGIYNGFNALVVIDGSSITGNGVDPVELDSRQGGGIYNQASLEVTNSDVSDNAVEQFSGGALYNTGAAAVATLTDTTLARNRATGLGIGLGGAIINLSGGRVTMTRGALEANEGDLGGAAAAFGAGSVLSLVDVAITGNRAFSGGALHNTSEARLEVTGGEIGANVADFLGGGVYNLDPGSVAVLVDVAVDDNQAGTGGGIANVEAQMEITRGSVDRNTASLAGGGIHNDEIGATLVLDGTSVSDNGSDGPGGGIENSKGASLDGTNVVLSGNTAALDGGAIRNDQGFGFGLAVNAVSLVDCTIQGNTAGLGGGAISSESAFESSSTVDLSNCLVGGEGPGEGNTAETGGAFSLVAAATTGPNELVLRDGTRVVGNGASSDGGAIHAYGDFQGPLTIEIRDAELASNDASGSGGALHGVVDSGATLDVTVTRTSVSGNVADGQGGAFFVDSRFDFAKTGATTLEVTDATVTSNVAGLEGGAFFVDQSTGGTSSLSVEDTIVADNVAADGGALYHLDGTSRIHTSCIQRNTDVAVVNAGAGVQDATGNWWGASDGPGPVGPGSGDTVSAGIDFANFATAPFADCGVAIDIRPRSSRNRIWLWSWQWIPVALLGSDGLDVDDVDLDSLRFEGASRIGWKVRHKDVNDDGHLDLITFYKSWHTDIEPDQTEACLVGETIDGGTFEGCDAIETKLPWWARWWGKKGHGHHHHHDDDDDDD